jgi:hypothetical protein
MAFLTLSPIFGPACREALAKIEDSDIGNLIINKTNAHAELQSYLSLLEIEAKHELQHRERVPGRVDMQLKVVWTHLATAQFATRILLTSSGC